MFKKEIVNSRGPVTSVQHYLLFTKGFSNCLSFVDECHQGVIFARRYHGGRF